MSERAAFHRTMETLTISLVDEMGRINEARRRSDLASSARSWLPILCIGAACLNLLGGMTALLIVFR